MQRDIAMRWERRQRQQAASDGDIRQGERVEQYLATTLSGVRARDTARDQQIALDFNDLSVLAGERGIRKFAGNR